MSHSPDAQPPILATKLKRGSFVSPYAMRVAGIRSNGPRAGERVERRIGIGAVDCAVVATDCSEFQAATVQLFDEPLGVARETATGRIEIITTVATWSKVKVTKADGSVLVGWTEAAPAPARPSSPADTGSVSRVNERYRSALLEAQTITQSARPRSPR